MHLFINLLIKLSML